MSDCNYCALAKKCIKDGTSLINAIIILQDSAMYLTVKYT